METAYAQALWKMVEGGTAPSKAVASIKALLEKEGRLALLPRVGSAFARIAAREAGKNDLVLTVAREADERSAKSAAKKALAEHGITEGDLKTQVDDTIVGGWRLEGRGMLVDMSYKNQLLSIYHGVVGA